MLTLASSLPGWAGQLLSYLYVAIGLGLVIFIHELGHFAVAKWCGVKVERFSIGFGPVLFKITRGETEYALSAIPFGGYVKMLGQDDADPGQLTDARIARDPRSYTSKTVPQRMAIISAGVFNNLVSAVLFFIIAFMMGVTYEPAILGSVAPGGPGWTAGLRAGDQITRVNSTSDPELWFVHLKMSVALSDGPVELAGLRGDTREPFQTTVYPEMKPEDDALFPVIKVEPSQALRVRSQMGEQDKSPADRGTGASRADPPFEFGDVILQIDGEPIESYVELQRMLADKRAQKITITVSRKGKTIDLKVPPTTFRSVGLQMDIGKIVAIQKGSPADGKLQVGDRITKVITEKGGEQTIGDVIDPLKLPDVLAEMAGQKVKLKVHRQPEKGDAVEETIELTPDDRPGWVERPSQFTDAPLSIPAIGVAYHVLQTVIKVDPDSDAAKARVKPNDIIEELQFLLPGEKPGEFKPDANGKPIKFTPSERNWARAFELMQFGEYQKVRLKIRDRKELVDLTIRDVDGWYRPVRGIGLSLLQETYRSKSVGKAVVKGFEHTRDQVLEMYMMLRRLGSGRVSSRALGGPITIFKTAFMFAEKGVADLILFLGILSVSLAVLNFLPIPVLDGGHFVFLLWEGIRGKPASVRVIETATYVGLVMLLALMTWVMFLDIGRLIGN